METRRRRRVMKKARRQGCVDKPRATWGLQESGGRPGMDSPWRLQKEQPHGRLDLGS